MTKGSPTAPDIALSCASCEACCCRLELMLMTNTEVPEHYIGGDHCGGTRMARLEDRLRPWTDIPRVV